MHQRAKICLAILSALVCVAALTAASEEPDTSSGDGTLTESGARTLVEVEVIDDVGAPDPGTAVSLLAWPPGEELAGIEVGAMVDVVEIGSATTGADGVAALEIDQTIDVRDLASASGLIDVEVVVNPGESRTASHTFSIALSDARDLPEDPARTLISTQTRRVSHPTSIVLTPTSQPSQVGQAPSDSAQPEPETLDTTVLSRAPRRGATTAAVTAAAGFPNGCPISGTKKLANLGNRWVNIGNVFSRGRGKHMTFKYSGTADSELGIAVSASGTRGSFTAGGTVRRERTVGVGFPVYKRPRALMLDTQFSYGKYCTTYRSPGPSFQFTVKPDRHEGGTRHRKVAMVSATNCARYRVANSESTMATSDAMTWTNGAKLNALIGIDLSTRTGFRTDAEQWWKFVKPGRLCGSNDSPGGSPRVLVMKRPG